MVESALKFSLSKKLYLWQKSKKELEQQNNIVPVSKDLIPKLSESKLRDLTWSLDINDTISKQRINTVAPKKTTEEEINNFQGMQDDIKKIKWQSR